MPSEIIVALIGLGGAAIGSLATSLVAERRLRVERTFDRRIGALLKELLSTSPWKVRTFETLQRHCKGLGDDDLRRTLLSIGAICLTSKDGKEVWGLLDRVRDDITPDASRIADEPSIELPEPAQAPADGPY